MINTKNNLKLDNYELGIIEDLENMFGYDNETALNILYEYRQVLVAIGGYDNTSDQAERFDNAWQAGEIGELWLESIQKLQKEHKKRKKSQII